MDVVKLKITVKDGLEFDEINEVVISQLRMIAEQLESTGGQIQNLRGSDDDSTIEYTHLKGV